MLSKVSDKVLYCLNRASDCQRRANRSRDVSDQQFWIEQQKNWLNLSQSYEQQIRTRTFLDSIDGPNDTELMILEALHKRHTLFK